jgi:predicted ATPase
MVVERIQLKNFKNFENIDLKLGQMNVIVGANASGKTNLIQAIKFVRDIQSYGVENAISLQSGVEYLQNFNSGNRSTTISFEFNHDAQIVLMATNIDILIVSFIKKITYQIVISSKSEKNYKIDSEDIVFHFDIREIKKRIFRSKYLSRNDIEQQSNILDKCTVTFKSENGTDNFNSVLQSDKRRYELMNKSFIESRALELVTSSTFFNLMGHETSNNKSILERISKNFFDLSNLSIYDFDIKKMKNPASIAAKAELEENGENLAIVMKKIFEDKKKLTQFSNLIKDILPFINDIDTENSYDKSISLKVKEKYNPDTAIPGSLLSDGTVSITAILTALYFEDKSLAIFEEPEHGVHPSLISKLMESFYDASKNKQIIITTHSPEVLKNTVKEDIFLLLRKDNGNASIVKPHKNKMVKSFLKNELGIDQLFIQNLLES